MIDLLIMGLACWRLCALIAYECGPWDIFRLFRTRIGIKHLDKCEPTIIGNGFMAQLFGCVWCISVWFAIMIYGSWLIWPGMTIIVLSPFALSAAAIIVEEFVRG